MSFNKNPQLPPVGRIPILPGFPSWLSFTQGNIWHVRPFTGNDLRDGTTPATALKTLAKALSLATANQNDVVLLYSEHASTTSSTTASQTATLDWNKNMVHLIGVNAGGPIAQRSRVAFASSYATASNLFTLSANSCYIANIHFFEGVASALPTGCFKVTGQRNLIHNCHIAGIGNDANDIAGAYSLYLSGAAENEFRECQIGLDTIAAGTGANSEILVDTQATRNIFNRCTIFRLIEHATNHPLVKLSGATAIDRTLEFNDCSFISESVNYGVAQSGIFKLTVDITQGFIILRNAFANDSDDLTAPKWDVDDRNRISLFNAPTPAADTAGIGRQV